MSTVFYCRFCEVGFYDPMQRSAHQWTCRPWECQELPDTESRVVEGVA